MMRRRAVILLSVLVLVTLSALVGSTLMLQAIAVRGAADRELGQAQSRAIAWSAVQAVMADLASGRDALLLGEPPMVDAEGVLFEVPDGAQGVYRLLPMGGRLLVPESAKLDINAASEEMLARMPGVGESLAAEIVARREASPISSVDDLVGINGVTLSSVYGGGRAGDGFEGAAPPLAELLTVFSFDPQVQCGIGREESRGRTRVYIGGEWSEELGEAVNERFGDGSAAALKMVFDAGIELGKPSDLARLLRDRGLPIEFAAQVLDVFTTTEGEYAFGRVDLNTASADVLASLPGLDEDSAAAIVDARERVDPADRMSVTWPVEQELIGIDAFIEAVDWLTVRSTQWRVVIEAGLRTTARTAGEDFGAGAAFDPSLVPEDLTADEFGVAIEQETDEPDLRDRVVYEAVIDVSAERPRLAWFAEITGRSFMLEAEAARGDSDDADGGVGREGELPFDGPGDESGDEVPPGRSGYVDGPATGIGRGSLVDRTGFGDVTSGDPPDMGGTASEASSSSGDTGGASSGSVGGRIGRWRAGRSTKE